jgi:hypothetical protein
MELVLVFGFEVRLPLCDGYSIKTEIQIRTHLLQILRLWDTLIS